MCSACEEDKPRSAFSETQMHKAEKKCKTCLAGTHWRFFLTPSVHSSRHVLCSFDGAFCVLCTVPATGHVNLRVHSVPLDVGESSKYM